MDFTPLAQEALNVGGQLLVLVVVGLIGLAAGQVQKRYGIAVSQASESAIDAEITSAINTAVGIGRADLVSGKLNLAHITLGNPAIDALAQLAIKALSAKAANSGVTVDGVAKRILAGIGHALGDDPTVPTMPRGVPA